MPETLEAGAWPLADEPPSLPPPGGATDADLGGVDVSHEYIDEDGNFRGPLGDTSPGTWAAIYAYARSFLGSKPPGWVKENVNTFTKKFYGNSTKAAWCLIFIWCMLTHFGVVVWKLAYVPWLNRIPGEHNGRSGIKAGDVCAIAGYSHVGFYVADRGDYFDLLSGNSTSGSSTDAITIKRYSKSVISGYVKMTYAATPPPAPATSADDSGFVVGCA